VLIGESPKNTAQKQIKHISHAFITAKFRLDFLDFPKIDSLTTVLENRRIFRCVFKVEFTSSSSLLM